MRVLALTERSERAALSKRLFRAVWSDGQDLSNRSVLRDLVGEEGLEKGAMLDAMEHLEKTTEEAVARGAFGSPSFFVGRELFFGNDRIDFLEAVVMANKGDR